MLRLTSRIAHAPACSRIPTYPKKRSRTGFRPVRERFSFAGDGFFLHGGQRSSLRTAKPFFPAACSRRLAGALQTKSPAPGKAAARGMVPNYSVV